MPDEVTSPPTKKTVKPQKDGLLFSAGPALVSGAVQAILFNPIDRALYVRVRHRRAHFLDWRNFERPFQGFMNAAVYRTLVGASYMFWQDSVRILIERFFPASCQRQQNPQLNSVMIGLGAGSVNGFALNTLQAVKFRMWNSDAKGVTFFRTSVNMFREGGILIFFRGCLATVVRDSVFGVIYETTRRANVWKDFFTSMVSEARESRWVPLAWRPPHETAAAALTTTDGEAPRCGFCEFFSNLVAALMASILSSPFNYVRSVVYGTPSGAIPLGYTTLLRSFYTQYFFVYRHGKSFTDPPAVPSLDRLEHRAGATASSTEPRASVRPPRPMPPTSGSAIGRLQKRVQHWCDARGQHPLASWRWANSRLNIGWGSLRVGLGMALGQSMFHFAQDFAHKRQQAARDAARQ